MSQLCAHCGRVASGSASVQGKPVCHPPVPDRADCYRLVTVYGEEIGSRRRCSMTEYRIRKSDAMRDFLVADFYPHEPAPPGWIKESREVVREPWTQVE